MSNLAKTILSTAKALPEGGLISAKEFLHLASRASIDQTLTRLTRAGLLLRISRGTYVLPVVGTYGARAPSTEAVIKAISQTSNELIVTNGASAANALGLTTQIPIREVLLTSGRSRKFKLGNRVVELKHGRRGELVIGERPAGMAIRALFWLGPEQAPIALKKLRSKLTTEEWDEMRAIRAALPSWMARAISESSHYSQVMRCAWQEVSG